MEFQEEMEYDGSTCMKWHHRDNRVFVVKRGVHFDNHDVVPYNAFLTKKYNCHICVEVCSTNVGCVHYLFDYVLKGQDMIEIHLCQEECMACGALSPTDEVAMYRTGKYKGFTEALWRIYEFPIVHMSPRI
jgi:ferredoxin